MKLTPEEWETLKKLVDDLLETLPARQKRIMVMHFGLDRGIPRLLADVAKPEYITRERARQIEARALFVLRKSIPKELAQFNFLPENPLVYSYLSFVRALLVETPTETL